MTNSRDADFELFVASCYARLVRAAYVMVGQREAAEDLVQQALLKVYPVWRRGAPASPEAYVRTTMLRLAMRESRRNRLIRSELNHEPVDRPTNSPEDPTLPLALHRALQTLPPATRAVLVLRFLYGLSEKETAEALRCAPGTVKSRTSRALEALRNSGLLDDKDAQL